MEILVKDTMSRQLSACCYRAWVSRSIGLAPIMTDPPVMGNTLPVKSEYLVNLGDGV